MTRAIRIAAFAAVLALFAGPAVPHGDWPGPRFAFLAPPLPPPVPEPAEAVPEEAEAAPAVPAAPAPEETAPPLAWRYIVVQDPCPPPTTQEIVAEERIGAGPVVRFYTRGSRVEESEADRAALATLPLGRTWPWYEARIREMGFVFVDATWSARDRPRFALEKDGLRFRLEIACDSFGKIVSIDAGPNL